MLQIVLRFEMLPLTKVFAKAGLDNVTSAMCYYRQRFRLDVHYSTLVHNFNHIFPSGHLYRAGRTMNSLPSQILERCRLCRWTAFGSLQPDKTLYVLLLRLDPKPT